MFASLDIAVFPQAASAFATDWEMIFWYINTVTVVSGLLVYACIVVFCFAYARGSGPPRKTPRILGSTKLEIAWTAVPLFFFLTFFVWGTKVYVDHWSAPADAPEYFVVGKQWMWKIQHPDGTREINELHIPVNTTVRVLVTSEDVIHDFGVPAFRSKIDAVPGRYVVTWYRPDREGTYHLFCDQYCGMGHSQMVGKVHVLSQADYEGWKEGTYRDPADLPGGTGTSGMGWAGGKKITTDGSPAWEGRKLFMKLQCNDCHNASNTARAPQLAGMYGSYRPVQGGRVVKFDDEYIKESIRNPMAKVADGWKPIMPAFPPGQVDEIELRNLVAYIKSLKTPADLPVRTQQGPAPVGAPTTPTQDQGTPMNGGPKK